MRNSRSGTACGAEKVAQALRAGGIDADILDMPPGRAIDGWIDQVAGRYDVLAAAGGDGTVSSVAAGVARAGKTLAVLPTGTLNHFARDLRIPTELAGAVDLLRTGLPHAVDIGDVNGRCFLNNVSIGSYPRMVRERTRLEQRGRSRRVAGVIAVAKTWWHLRSLTASINIDGRDLLRRSPFIVIANGAYDLAGFDLSRRDNISDDQLSLYVAPRSGRLGAASLPFRALLGTLDRYEQFETVTGRAITIALPHRQIWAGIDGEVRELESPLRFVVKPAALRVIVPSPLDSPRRSTS